MKTKANSLALHDRSSGDEFQLDQHTADRIHRARSNGRPLDRTIQKQMSTCLGYDLSQVHVHCGHEADALNDRLGARAFTVGSDVFFRHGEYNPDSTHGRELIAHELVHVVQQNTGRAKIVGDGITVHPTNDPFEREAHALAPRMARNRRVEIKPFRSPHRPQGHALQRALADVVAGNVVGAAGLPILCHYATVYWAYRAAHGVAPSENRMIDFGNTTLVIKEMLKNGQRRTKPLGNGRPLQLTPGSVLVFAADGENPDHSCVAIQATQIGGYNNADWFNAAPQPNMNTYSTHTTDLINWTGVTKRVGARPGHGGEYKIFTIPEEKVLKVINSM